jgi:hypothetical protein
MSIAPVIGLQSLEPQICLSPFINWSDFSKVPGALRMPSECHTFRRGSDDSIWGWAELVCAGSLGRLGFCYEKGIRFLL